MRTRQRSLVSALSIRFAFLLTAGIALIGAIAYWSAKAQINEIYDSELITGTQLLHTLANEEIEEYAEHKTTGSPTWPPTVLLEEDIESFNTYGQWRMFRIWHGSKLIARSANGPAQMATPRVAGFFDLADGDTVWRLYLLQARDAGLLIAVGEETTQRDAVVQKFALSLIVPLLLLVPAGAGLIWLTLLDGLGALRQLAAALRAKSGRNLSPLDPAQWPRDLGEMLTAMNGLLHRLDQSFRQTQRFTDHAAHELRTPLAGLKLNAQLIATEKDPEEQRAIARRLRAGAEHASTLVEQLLMLAQLDSGTFETSPNDVIATAKSVLEAFAPAAAANDVKLALTEGPAVMVRADAVLLKVVLSNLVDNAIKHSPRGSEVAIDVAREPIIAGTVRVSVMDQGPGIPNEERQRVFERFYRLDSGGQRGVGLGLAIVAEALAQLDGSILLESPAAGPGLLAVVRLRAA